MIDLTLVSRDIISHIAYIGYKVGKITTISYTNNFSSKAGITRKDFSNNSFSIEINAFLNDKAIIDTLAHELIHTISGCFNHGTKFKKIAKLLNEKFGYNIESRYKGNVFSTIPPKAKYKVVCNNCNKISFYERKPRNLIEKNHLCICPNCKSKGSFQVYLLR